MLSGLNALVCLQKWFISITKHTKSTGITMQLLKKFNWHYFTHTPQPLHLVISSSLDHSRNTSKKNTMDETMRRKPTCSSGCKHWALISSLWEFNWLNALQQQMSELNGEAGVCLNLLFLEHLWQSSKCKCNTPGNYLSNNPHKEVFHFGI